MKSCFRRTLFMIFCLAVIPVSGWGQSAESFETEWIRDADGVMREAVRGEVLIRYRQGVDDRQRDRTERSLGVERSRRVGGELWRARVSPDRAREIVGTRVRHPEVDLVQPNYIYRLQEPLLMGEPGLQEDELRAGRLPDDPHFWRQWGLYNEGQTYRSGRSGVPGADSRAHLAWEVTRGSDEVVVAVFDTGIDYNHPDLAPNMFVDEQGRPGVDCSPSGMSGGGCSDDPMDPHGHGTHIAGIIGAVGDNGIGVSGVNWQVRLMAVKIFSEDPNRPGEYITSDASILAGYDYALSRGAQISNHSYGGPASSPPWLQREKIRQAGDLYDHLVIASSGNAASGEEGEETAIYPAAYDLSNVISVASTNAEDELSRFSHYGEQWVDLAAPGEQIYSTYPGEAYQYLSGTSMASPFVAGAAALVRSVFPQFSHEEIRSLLIEEADQLASLEGRIADGRRLNMLRSLPAGRVWLTHGSLSDQVEEVDLWVNDRLVESGIAYAETTDRLYLPAGVELELSIRASSLAGSTIEWHREDVRVDRDRRYRSLFYGTDPWNLLMQEETRGDPEEGRVSVQIIQLLDSSDPMGLYGIYPDGRPSTIFARTLASGEASDPVQVPPVEMELDLTREDERLHSVQLPFLAREGERLTVWITDGATPVSYQVLLSSTTGEGVVAGEVRVPQGELRHRSDVLVLENNFPNPFRSQTMIQFSLPESGPVRVEVVDLLGRRVQLLVDEELVAGIHRIPFLADGMASGMYLFRVATEEASRSGKMMLIR
ncbi:MAG: S8 family serine peptidase [Balneolaceae bacterium]